MLQGVQDAVMIHVIGHIIRRPFRIIGRIAHRYAESRIGEHRRIVAAVAECDRLLASEAVMVAKALDAAWFAAVRGNQIRERGVPADPGRMPAQRRQFVLRQHQKRKPSGQAADHRRADRVA